MKTAGVLLFLMFFFGYLFGTAGTVFFTNMRIGGLNDISMSPPNGLMEFDNGMMEKLNLNDTNISSATIRVPAVNQDKEGVATILRVSVVPGSGRTLVNIDKLLFWVDTQTSIRTSRDVASQFTGLELSSVDTIYTITADASVIEGGSAGAALTLASIAALENKKLNEDVMITGTINQNGVIGPIGEVLEKAKVAKELGATTFLVPRSQSVQIVYQDARTCNKVGLTEICETEKIPHRIDVETEAGIKVIEVINIDDAARYFFEE
ncbi:MAG: S16 family serine protease [Candidatus Aenigmatarchaeota archaeon]|nr:hypothetical protein [Nanoarchaeota archaeon]